MNNDKSRIIAIEYYGTLIYFPAYVEKEVRQILGVPTDDET